MSCCWNKKPHPSNVASKPTDRDGPVDPFIFTEQRGSGSSLKQQVGLDNLELPLGMQAARVAIFDSHPVHFEHVGWVCIFLLAMATEDVRNMRKLPEFLHELGFRWFFLCVGTLCLAFGLNFVLWIWPSYAWGKTLISASLLSMWTYVNYHVHTHVYINYIYIYLTYTYIYVIIYSFCIDSSRIWDV